MSGGATVPSGFDALLNIPSSSLPGALTQLSGELATASQQTTFDAMNLFLGLLTDPFIAGRGDPVSGSTGVLRFAEDNDSANAYAANDKARTKGERDAYAALYRKAPAMATPSRNAGACGGRFMAGRRPATAMRLSDPTM